MKHEFEHNGSTVCFTEEINGVIHIEAFKCGMRFVIGQIVDFDNENPLVYFDNFAGVNLVEAIAKEIKTLKVKV
jgi:hypothetical protein